MSKKPVKQEIHELQDSYLRKLPEKLKEMQLIHSQLLRQPNDWQALEKMKFLCHQMYGTSGSYDFTLISHFAGQLEQTLIKAVNTQSYSMEVLSKLFEDLKNSINSASVDRLKGGFEVHSPVKGRLLIIDDDEVFLLFLSNLLAKQGFQTSTTSTPEHVIQLIADQDFDLLLIDIEMPTLSGLELCKMIRNDEKGCELPIIFLTAHHDTANRVTAFRAGADDFINKPIVLEELMARVSIRLARASLMREKQEMLYSLQVQYQSLLNILNQLKVGTIMIQEDGTIAFMSDSCSLLGGLIPENALGQPWQKVLPFDKKSKRRINQILLQNKGDLRIPLNWRFKKQQYWVDCELKEVPTRPGQYLLYLYDQSKLHRLRRQIEQCRFGQMIGDSEPMQQMYKQIELLARGEWNVLIEGETGVGKELVAHSIHMTSPRKDGPFIPINSAGLSESLLASQLFGHRRGAFTGATTDQVGFFEEASGGTLFLDEIGDMPLSMQSSLLRVLQEKEITRVGESRTRKVDVRIIAATHKDLPKEVREGRFREDLLYRLRVARIFVPPLRERREDIPILVNAFLIESCRTAGFPLKQVDPEFIQWLQDYSWPGNIRELKATLDYVVIRNRNIHLLPEDLPPELQQKAGSGILTEMGEEYAPGDESLNTSDFESLTYAGDERARIYAALKHVQGNRTLAAKLLGISRATFYRRLKDLKINLRE